MLLVTYFAGTYKSRDDGLVILSGGVAFLISIHKGSYPIFILIAFSVRSKIVPSVMIGSVCFATQQVSNIQLSLTQYHQLLHCPKKVVTQSFCYSLIRIPRAASELKIHRETLFPLIHSLLNALTALINCSRGMLIVFFGSTPRLTI